MSTRDRYTRNIKCPDCGEEGVLHLSENDYPFMKNIDLQIDKIDGKFTANLKDETDISVSCMKCFCELIS